MTRYPLGMAASTTAPAGTGSCSGATGTWLATTTQVWERSASRSSAHSICSTGMMVRSGSSRALAPSSPACRSRPGMRVSSTSSSSRSPNTTLRCMSSGRSGSARRRWQPFLPSPRGGGETLLPWALLRLVVGLGPVAPGVVRGVVVVPDEDHRVAEVQRRQVGVEAGVGVAAAIVVEGHRHPRRVDLVGPLGLLVEVVAEVDHQVDLVLGDGPVGGQRTHRPVGAAHEREARPTRSTRGGFGCARSERQHPVGLEPVVVGRRRSQPADLDRDAPVTVDRDVGALPPRDHLGHQIQRRSAHGDGGAAAIAPAHPADRRIDPGPQQDGVDEGIEAGDAMGEWVHPTLLPGDTDSVDLLGRPPRRPPRPGEPEAEE